MNPIVLIAVLSGAAVAALILLRARRRRPGQGEPGEDIGYGPENASIGAPDSVEVGGENPPRPAPTEWDDLSERRRLPLGEYRPAPDERETEPKEMPR